jgi:hypothetical protein
LKGNAHGGEEPTPGSIIRFAALSLLVIVIAVHHLTGFARAPA